MRERTTKRQRELLNFVDAFIKGHDYSPSYREIAEALGFKSVSTVSSHINNLINLGYIKKNSDEARSLEVIPPPSEISSHENWLKRKIYQQIVNLEEQNSSQSRRDIEVLRKASKLLGVDE
ncbi:winged helix-turn-helix transcriptional regulator [Candidatus Saccharibacteria bacterium]|jgi:repressor LexA|nr:winged helix-turn-helix transcriptional regulator [Candidatus Saccharibacteria bacterium]